MTEPRDALGSDLPGPAGPALDLPAPSSDPVELPAPALEPDPGGAAEADTHVLDPTGEPGNPGEALDVDSTVTSGAGSTATSPVPSDGGRAARRRASEELAESEAAVSRRRVVIAAGVVVAVLLAVVGGWLVLGRGSGNDPASPLASPTATGPVQPTLLFLVQDKQGVALNDALLSVGGSVKHANVITIPSTVVVDVATGGTLPFGQIARLPDADGPANALSDAIGVNVDGTLAMNTLAFSGLVDAVGGITADVDVDVIDTKPDGTQTVVVNAGKGVVLQGPEAAAYATYLAPGEPEEARMARFTQVLRLTVAKLPSDVTKVESILSGLGASSRSTVPIPDVAAFLVKLQADVLVDNASYKNLPVKSIDTGGPSVYGVDQVAAAAMVQELLPDAARKPGPNSKVRVLVKNGVGTPGLNAAARQRLVDAGFTFVNGANAPTLGQTTTQIVVPDSSEQSRKWGTDIALALGVSPSDVVVDSSGQSVADVIVILGEDFKPTSS